MPESASPDLDAFLCYGLLLAVGAIVAVVRLSGELAAFRGAWLMGETWLLFFAYVAVPLLLYWLLDRTGAIRDTSVFSALIVGVGYQQILTGSGGSGIQAPGEVSTLWAPFVAWADRLAGRIAKRIHRNEERFRSAVIRSASEESRLAILKEYAVAAADDQATLEAALAEIEGRTGLGEQTVREQKAELLYDEAASSDDYRRQLHEKGVVNQLTYLWVGLDWRLGAWFGIVLAGLLVSMYYATDWTFRQIDMGQTSLRYDLWRLHKENASSADRFRAYVRTKERMSSPAWDEGMSALFAEAVRQPGLTPATVERLIGLALETRVVDGRSSGRDALLIDALRSESVDARARINNALLLLAEDRGVDPAGLGDWKPREGDSVVEVERRIREWRTVLVHSPLVHPCRDLGSQTCEPDGCVLRIASVRELSSP